MGTFLAYLALPIIYLISILPFWMIYKLSDLLCFFVYKVFGYRKKVVKRNLKNSFPTLANVDIERIEKVFYKHFCDMILESLKTLTMSERQISERVEMKNVEIFEKYFKENQSVVVAMGHLGNWEWAGVRFGLFNYHQLYAIYHPLKNDVFNRLIKKIRTKTGVKLYAMKDTVRGIIDNKNKLTATAFIADQTPSPKSAHWVSFMNQETPVFTGIAKISKKMNYPIIFASVSKKRRGRYVVDLELLSENPGELSEEEITLLHTKKLEKDIYRFPHLWLWTHRRWKHKRN